MPFPAFRRLPPALQHLVIVHLRQTLGAFKHYPQRPGLHISAKDPKEWPRFQEAPASSVVGRNERCKGLVAFQTARTSPSWALSLARHWGVCSRRETLESIILKAAENRLWEGKGKKKTTQQQQLGSGHRNLMGHFDLGLLPGRGCQKPCSQLANEKKKSHNEVFESWRVNGIGGWSYNKRALKGGWGGIY